LNETLYSDISVLAVETRILNKTKRFGFYRH